jgi:hypothetical protein
MPLSWGRATKKLLRERINENPSEIRFYNPSPIGGHPSCLASEMLNGARIVVTNHPQCSWFASVTREGKKFVVR